MNRLLWFAEIAVVLTGSVVGMAGDKAAAAWSLALACYLHLRRGEDARQ
jgi:hypothetical protein